MTVQTGPSALKPKANTEHDPLPSLRIMEVCLMCHPSNDLETAFSSCSLRQEKSLRSQLLTTPPTSSNPTRAALALYLEVVKWGTVFSSHGSGFVSNTSSWCIICIILLHFTWFSHILSTVIANTDCNGRNLGDRLSAESSPPPLSLSLDLTWAPPFPSCK